MNEKLNHFTYSQNSINTYKSCPTKFKYKYIDNINWKHDDVDSREYYNNLKLGTEFHLLCERYFSNIPLGLNDNTNEKFVKWIEKVKNLIKREDNNIYLPEYEVRLEIDSQILQAKYDLLIIKQNSIEIWDWKTENKKLDYKKLDSRMQTIVYMYLAKEVVLKIHNLNIDTKDIFMNYYQPEFYDECVSISYDDYKHKRNEELIKSYLDKIINTKYEQEEGKYDLVKNIKHCDYCEFTKLCNYRNNDVLKEESYER